MKNPYAPIRRASDEFAEGGLVLSPRGVLPVLRLRRLGASDGLVAWLAGVWGGMDDDGRAAAANDLAALGDRELMTRLVGPPPMGKGADAVVEWATAHDHPADAARHAVALGAGGPDAAARLADLIAGTS